MIICDEYYRDESRRRCLSRHPYFTSMRASCFEGADASRALLRLFAVVTFREVLDLCQIENERGKSEYVSSGFRYFIEAQIMGDAAEQLCWNGNEVRVLRKGFGLTQEELADALPTFYTAKNISDVELGKTIWSNTRAHVREWLGDTGWLKDLIDAAPFKAVLEGCECPEFQAYVLLRFREEMQTKEGGEA